MSSPNTASSLLEYLQSAFEEAKIQIDFPLRVSDPNNLNSVLSNFFKDSFLDIDTECIDSLSDYVDIFKQMASISGHSNKLSDITIKTADESGILAYDEAELYFTYESTEFTFHINNIESDYLSPSFLDDIVNFLKDNNPKEFVKLPSNDQGVSYIHVESDKKIALQTIIEAASSISFNTENEVKNHVIEYKEKGTPLPPQDELLAAISNKNKVNILRLLQDGVDPFEGEDPAIAQACYWHKDFEISKILIENAVTPKKIWIDVAFREAVLEKDLEFCRWILKYEPDPNIMSDGGAVLTHASYKGRYFDESIKSWVNTPVGDEDYEIIKFLLEIGASPDGARNDAIGSPMEYCIYSKDYRCIDLLLSFGAKLDTIKVRTATNWCAYSGEFNLLKHLLARGLKANPKKRKGQYFAAPLHYAIEKGHFQIVKLLIDNSAKLDYCADITSATIQLQQHFHKTSPLSVASQFEQFDIALLLLESGVECTTDDLGLLLLLATYQGKVETAKIVLTNGADINHCFSENTYYSMERSRKARDLIQLDLIDKTALSIAIEQELPGIFIEFLRANGAKESNPSLYTENKL